MTVTIPTQQQLRDRALLLLQKHMSAGKDAAPTQVNAIEAGMRRETNRVLSFMHAGVAEGILQYLRDHIARQAVPINATGPWLEDWCRTYRINVKPANRAQGSATGSGAAGAVLPADQPLQRADGQRYQPLTDLIVAANGTLTGEFRAIAGGKDGNSLGGVKLRLVSPAPGINNELTIDEAGFNGGADKESDDERLIRLLARIQNPPHGGNPSDYAMWAMEVAGVTRAWGYRTPYGPCTAGVAFLMDANDNNGIPNTADRQAVYDYIRHPDVGPPDELFVVELVAKPIDITFTRLTPDNFNVREAVRAELEDLFLRYRLPGDQITYNTIPLTQINEAISIAAGQNDHAITLTTDIVVSDREVPVLGLINWPGGAA